MTTSHACWADLARQERYRASAMARYLYPLGSARCTFNRSKFVLRSLLYRGPLSRIYRLFCEAPLCELPTRYPELLDKPMRPYRFASSSAHQRAAMVEEHYRLMLERFPSLIVPLYLEQGVEVGRIPDSEVRLVLRHDGTFRREAELSLSLLDGEGKRLYSCAFSLERCGGSLGLVIGSVQGPEPSVDAPQERVRLLTKQCHGLRPKSLVVMLVLMLAESMGANRVSAIRKCAHIFQAKRYSKKKKECLQADYDELWGEFGARVLDANFVTLAPLERKPLEEIASKKRAMYRRRYDWLDELARRLDQVFG